MMKRLAFGGAPCYAFSRQGCDTARTFELPTRSMVGQLPLEQHIGVRIPGGQPKPLPKRFSKAQDGPAIPFVT